MDKKVVVIVCLCKLQVFFLAGEADRTRRYTAETMLEELNIMVEEEGQFDKSEVPKLQTIHGG